MRCRERSCQLGYNRRGVVCHEMQDLSLGCVLARVLSRSCGRGGKHAGGKSPRRNTHRTHRTHVAANSRDQGRSHIALISML